MMTDSTEFSVRQAARPGAASMSSRANKALWVVQIVTAVSFFGAGASKFFYPIELFDQIGWGVWFQYLTGSLEVVGAVALLIRRLSGVAALAFVGLSIVAIVFHILVLVEPMIFILILGILAAVVAWGRRQTTIELFNQLRTGTVRR